MKHAFIPGPARRRGRALFGLLAAAALIAPLSAQAETLTIGLASEPTSIDPHFHNLTPNSAFSRHLFDRLVGQDEKQRMVPQLAVSWEPISETTWEFKLREGVKFHDGSEFTADDVIFTAERAPDVPNSPSSYGTYLKGKTFKKIDDYTVQVTTESPYPLMPNDIATIAIISKNAAEGKSTEDFNSGEAAIGTGPYKFVEWVPGDRIVLEANENYWGEAPQWDKVVIKPIKSGPARVAALLAGDVDMIDGVPTTDIARLKQEDDVALNSGISNRVIYLHIDTARDKSPFVTDVSGDAMDQNPLKDLRVRRAISKAINREAIVDRIMEGAAIPAAQLLPEGFFGVSPNLEVDPYDLDASKALLADAGYPDGFGLTIHGPNNRYINDAKIAETIAQMLTRAGIKTAVETMPKSVYFKRASRGGPDGTPEFSFVLVGWGAGTGEASSPLKSLLHTYDKEKGFGASNRGRYSNPQVDALIEEALSTVDDDARQQLLAEATEMAIGDLGIIPLHYQVNTWGTREGLTYLPRTDEATFAMGVSRTE